MPSPYPLDAFVLARKNFGEADRMLRVYSLENGQEHVLAKGIRRPLSSTKGALELFSLAAIFVQPSRSIPFIAEARAIETYQALRSRLPRVLLAHHVAETVLKLTQERDPNPDVFHLVQETFAYLDRAPNTHLVLESFRVRFLATIGFLPELRHCVSCLKEIRPNEHYFSFLDHAEGVLCADCKSSSAKLLSLNLFKALRVLATSEYETVARISLPKEDREAVRLFTQRLIEHHNQRELRSTRFVE